MQISDSSSRILAGLLEARTGQQLTMSRRWRIETALSSLLRERNISTLDELKLDVERLAIERLHHILIGAGFERRADVSHVVLSRAEDDFRLVAMATLAEQTKELHSTHHWHVPVQEHDVRHLLLAAGQRFLAVARFLDLELKRFENVAGDLPDHLGVIDDQTAFHF
jgi:hypothetical protein